LLYLSFLACLIDVLKLIGEERFVTFRVDCRDNIPKYPEREHRKKVVSLLITLFTASLPTHANEKASKATARHAGLGDAVCERSKQEVPFCAGVRFSRDSIGVAFNDGIKMG